MEDPLALITSRTPTPNRPLLGLTVLVVEDSRFACEALRLMCLRSGARIRRADCLRSARRHLQVYQPTVVIVDMGLPDGSGADLIAELDGGHPRVEVLLAISGDSFNEDVAIAAGADGFIAKPLTSLAVFQQEILSRLPADRQPPGPRAVQDETIRPDPVAYRDDLAHVADVLGDETDEKAMDYVVQFTSGVARSANDTPLLDAALALAKARAAGQPSRAPLAIFAGMVQERLCDKIAI